MENFKELTLNDKDLFTDYLKDFNNKSYEYSFTALYLWRDLCKTKYSIIDNCLIIKKKTNDGTFFMMPIGYNKSILQELILKLKDLSTDDNIYLLGDIEENFIYDLIKDSELLGGLTMKYEISDIKSKLIVANSYNDTNKYFDNAYSYLSNAYNYVINNANNK